MSARGFRATHEIALHRASGGIERIRVMLVDGAAYTRREWESATAAEWERSDDGSWTFQGQAAPSGGPRSVTVRALP